ncbi:succinate dehydrogenase, hydrophobic membrane anchor protein [Zavarzinia sp. CC-PAN008]|uniref:succinate dehydrogenase, hydrophobic membrane anchor protein n=1 Tax=Zavarzinia sp. CC-PAN008 TaxID=3243332 RepID=UPI003F742F1B
MSLRTPLARARGLGAAKDGVHHWWVQRLTAIALIPLVLWFIVSTASLTWVDHAGFVAWLSQPLVAVLMIALLGTLFYHLKLGAQVVIEDYVHGEAVKIASLVALNFACFIVGLAAIFAVLKVAL